MIAKKLWTISGIEWEDSAPSQEELYRLCLKIAWPAVVEGMLLSIINSIDTMMVGTMGSAAIAAVGLTGQPRMILLMLIQSLCAGTTAVVARRRGEEDQKGANACLHQSLTIVSLLSLIMAALGYLLAVPFMRFAGANADTLEMSVTYFRIICLALPANAWSLCICAGMRAVGKTKITMVTNITANLVNVCGNYLLIGGHFGFPALGVKGAAIATACGTLVSCLIAIIFACRKEGYLRLKLWLLGRFDKHTMHSLFSVGSSAAAESVFLRIGFLINNKLIAGIGTIAFAANQIVQQITSLSFTVGDGLATAGSALVGQNLGANRKNTAHGIIRIVRRISIFTSLV
ncbi:MAG: MATE family efflux transporter, partial [Clostridiales bacterium]|nr:MATE family efflux transporter [Clostridiales bacterium]